MKLADFPEIAALPAADMLDLIDAMYVKLAEDGDLPPYSAEQIGEFDRRAAAFHADPSTGLSWEQVKANLAHLKADVAREAADGA